MKNGLLSLIIVIVIWLSVSTINADIYKFTDEAGEIHFVDDLSKVPKKYRGQFTKDQEGTPPSAEVDENRSRNRAELKKTRKAKANPEKGESAASFADPLTGMQFVRVKGGCFRRGNIFNVGYRDEKPVTEVCVSDFAIGRFEVTQREWQQVIGTKPSYFKSCGPDCPVESVSWNDAQEFVNRLNRLTGGKYRLPTEAEWEYAARDRGREEKYAGGNDENLVAWYNLNTGATHPVGQKRPNSLGIFDMSGNVFEWVNDWYHDQYYERSPRNDPKGPVSGTLRAVRGGSWMSDSINIRAVNRGRCGPDARLMQNGFRLAAPYR